MRCCNCETGTAMAKTLMGIYCNKCGDDVDELLTNFIQYVGLVMQDGEFIEGE
jgi:anaerobic ribonucleoside-triphosphate reductase